MNTAPTVPSIDHSAADLLEMATNNRTQPEMLSWLFEQGVTVSRSTLTRQFTEWRGAGRERMNVQGQNPEDLAQAIQYFFHHHPTYSDLQMAIRIQEEYRLQATANQVQVIQLQHSC
jgi:hypothetical protein